MATKKAALKAFADQPAPRTLQKGKKGGTFYVSEGGKKVYTHELPEPKQHHAVEAATAVPKPRRKKAESAGEAGAPQAARPTTGPAKAKDAGKFRKEVTTPVPKVKGPDGKERPAAGAGAQLPPETRTRLQSLGVGKLPAAHIADVDVSNHLHDDEKAHKGALIQWKDDKGRRQAAYSEQHERNQAQVKWARVLANRPKVEAGLDEMRKRAVESPAHAAALLMDQTSLRPGSLHSVKAEGHYGATTIEARHVTFDGDKARLEFVGKQGKLNKAEVSDPALVAALRKHTEGKGPNDRVFDTTIQAVRAAAPKGVKLKDYRTIGATKHAEQLFEQFGAPVMTGNLRQDAKTVASLTKSVSEQVSERLNNTPAMARKSYISPDVVYAWAKKHGIPREIVKWP